LCTRAVYRIAETSLGVATGAPDQVEDGIGGAVDGSGWAETVADFG
jgi:hypothetical protein